MTLTLMTRIYCSLCTDMQAQLQALQAEFDFELLVFDVDADPDLEAKYDELVPVLLAGETELCHWHLDDVKVRAYLTNMR